MTPIRSVSPQDLGRAVGKTLSVGIVSCKVNLGLELSWRHMEPT